MGIIFKKISVYIKNHKTTTAILLVCIAITVVASPFIAVKFPDRDLSLSCFSIALDKYDMNLVNHIILETPEKKIGITDKKLIERIVSETMVADCTGYSEMYGDLFLYLYKGEDLIRTIKLSSTTIEYAIVFCNENKHWTFPRSDIGTAVLTKELVIELEQIFNENGYILPFQNNK